MKTPPPADLLAAADWLRLSCQGEDKARFARVADWLEGQSARVGKLSVRWRKASATWVIYLSGRVLRSGLDSADEARDVIRDTYGEAAAQGADYSRA